MRYSFLHKLLSVLLIAIILSATTAGLCHEAHAAGDALCRHHSQQSGTASIAAQDGHCPSCPDADHSAGQCESTCYCSCHLPVVSTGIDFSYSIIIIDHLSQQTFSPPQDIFLSLFVPPDIPA
jgi:hypothetical protein